MTHPDMIEGDAPLLPPDAVRAAAWRRVERMHQAMHVRPHMVSAAGVLAFQAELVQFAERYWTDMRRAFGATAKP